MSVVSQGYTNSNPSTMLFTTPSLMSNQVRLSPGLAPTTPTDSMFKSFENISMIAFPPPSITTYTPSPNNPNVYSSPLQQHQQTANTNNPLSPPITSPSASISLVSNQCSSNHPQVSSVQPHQQQNREGSNCNSNINPNSVYYSYPPDSQYAQYSPVGPQYSYPPMNNTNNNNNHIQQQIQQSPPPNNYPTNTSPHGSVCSSSIGQYHVNANYYASNSNTYNYNPPSNNSYNVNSHHQMQQQTVPSQQLQLYNQQQQQQPQPTSYPVRESPNASPPSSPRNNYLFDQELIARATIAIAESRAVKNQGADYSTVNVETENNCKAIRLVPSLSQSIIAGHTFVDITPYMTLPQAEAAKRLGIPASTLSKRWRTAAANRKWPWRLVAKIDKEITTLMCNVKSGEPLDRELQERLALLLSRREKELTPVKVKVS